MGNALFSLLIVLSNEGGQAVLSPKWMNNPKIKKPYIQTDLEKAEFGRQVLQQTQEFFLSLLVKGEKHVITRRVQHIKKIYKTRFQNASRVLKDIHSPPWKG